MLFLFTQCKAPQAHLSAILAAEYEEHFISSGDNFPEISLEENNRYKFLVGLHNDCSIAETQASLGWSDDVLQQEIALLKENAYLHEVEGKLQPAISIIMQKEGQQIYKQTEKVAETISESIINISPQIESLFNTMELAENTSFESMRFFLFSDVLLDNWQINNVERDFLKAQRTLRHGNRYYIQYAEKDPEATVEVFGIYGNQYNCKDDFCFITYGNNRENHYKPIKELMAMDIPYLSVKDQAVLDEMASLYQPVLIEILEQNRQKFEKDYHKSKAQQEISFEEYFIWYYHFLYTSATNKLAQKGYMTIPQTGVFSVKLAQ